MSAQVKVEPWPDATILTLASSLGTRILNALLMISNDWPIKPNLPIKSVWKLVRVANDSALGTIKLLKL